MEKETYLDMSCMLLECGWLMVIILSLSHRIIQAQSLVYMLIAGKMKPIKIKTHHRPAVSLFRYDLDYIVDILTNLFYKQHLLSACLAKIKPPQPDYILHGTGV